MGKLTFLHQPPRHADRRPYASVEGFGRVLSDFLFWRKDAASPEVFSTRVVEDDVAGVIEDAEVEGSGVPIDAGVESVRLVVRRIHDLLGRWAGV
jgi:hypothetical protein